MMARNTAEYLAITKATSKLTRAVKNDLVWLSAELVSRQLITADQGAELRNGKIDELERAAHVVKLVTDKVEQDRKNFRLFVRLLIENRSVYEDVLKSLEPVYINTGGHVYNRGAPAVLTITQPWYHKRLSRQEAETRLREIDTNSFLVRESTQDSGKLVLSIKNRVNYYHFPIERGVGSYQIEGTGEPFSSVVELIDHYKQYGLPESNSGKVILLESPCVCDVPLVDRFTANATGFNGSFSGPCIVILDHQAITVINEQDEVEIAKWPYSCIRYFNFDGKFSFVSGNQGPFGVGEYTFEVHNVKKLEHTLKQFIGMQISRSRLKPQPYYYYPQCQCAQEKKHLSDSHMDSRSIFVSHVGLAKIHALPLPGPTRDCLHEVNDPLYLTDRFPLRHSFSTGDLLESSSSSFPPRQVSHKTHVRLFVSLSGEGPCIVEDEQHQSTSTQFTMCTSDDVPALLPREYPAHPRINSPGRIPTPPSSSNTSASSNNPKKQQAEHCSSILSPRARVSSQSPSSSEMLDLSVTPKQAMNDALQIADFSNVGYLPRSSPQVSRSVRPKFKAKRSPTQLNQ